MSTELPKDRGQKTEDENSWIEESEPKQNVIEQTVEPVAETTVEETKNTEEPQPEVNQGFDINQLTMDQPQVTTTEVTETTPVQEETQTTYSPMDNPVPIQDSYAEYNGGTTETQTTPNINEPTPPVEQPAPVQQSQEANPVQQNNGGTFNLDDMLNEPAGQQPVQEVAQPVYQEQPAQQVQPQPQYQQVAQPQMQVQPEQNPYNVKPAQQAVNPQQANATKKKQSMGSKILMIVLMLAVLVGAGFYILKTMYPAEFDSLMGGNKQPEIQFIDPHANKDNTTTPETNTGSTVEENNTETQTGSEHSAADHQNNIVMDTEENLVEDNTDTVEDTIPEETENTTETPEIIEDDTIVEDIVDDTIDEEEFNPFEDLDEMLEEETNPNQEIIDQLTEYNSQGEEFLDLGYAINDKTVIKYSLYITKKSTEFIEQLEIGEDIDISKVEKYLAQFGQYLTKLQEIVDESSNVPETSDAGTGSQANSWSNISE